LSRHQGSCQRLIYTSIWYTHNNNTYEILYLYTCIASSTSNTFARGMKNNLVLVHFDFTRVVQYIFSVGEEIHQTRNTTHFTLHFHSNTVVAPYDLVTWVWLIFSRHKIHLERSETYRVRICYKTQICVRVAWLFNSCSHNWKYTH